MKADVSHVRVRPIKKIGLCEEKKLDYHLLDLEEVFTVILAKPLKKTRKLGIVIHAIENVTMNGVSTLERRRSIKQDYVLAETKEQSQIEHIVCSAPMLIRLNGTGNMISVLANSLSIRSDRFLDMLLEKVISRNFLAKCAEQMKELRRITTTMISHWKSGFSVDYIIESITKILKVPCETLSIEY